MEDTRELWRAVGHALPLDWVGILSLTGALGLAGLLLYFVARAIQRRHRYVAVDVLSPSDVEELHAAIRSAEKQTVGEIVPVVLERSDAHPSAAWLSASVTVFLGSILLAGWLPWGQPVWFLLCQAGLGALGFGLAHLLPDYRRVFISERRATEMAEEQASQEFFRLGLHETEAKTGVLLFVSLLERRVILLADEGISEHVEADTWARTDGVILDGIVRGQLASGLRAGIEEVSAVLAEHHPWKDGDRNELPDRMVVRRD